MSNRYSIYRKDDGYVVNCIVYDGLSEYALENHLAMELLPKDSFAGIGWTRINNGEYVEPVEILNATE